MKIDNFSNFRLFNTTPIYSPEDYASREHFEHYFYTFYIRNKDKFPENLEYIPVFWHSYENCKKKNLMTPGDLQDRLNSLDKSKKYFTVCSHYLGIRYELPERTTVFTAATDPDDKYGLLPHSKSDLKNVNSLWHETSRRLSMVKIPLLKHPYDQKNEKRDNYFCSFVGAINTHKCRKDMCEEFNNKKGILIKTYDWKELHDWDDIDYYPTVVGSSTFTLCPRGFGRTSYRLYEAMQLGSIPVYFYDNKFLPYEDEINWRDICLMIPFERIKDSYRILRLKTEVDAKEYRQNIKTLYRKYFTRDGICDYILRKLADEN